MINHKLKISKGRSVWPITLQFEHPTKEWKDGATPCWIWGDMEIAKKIVELWNREIDKQASQDAAATAVEQACHYNKEDR